MRKPFSPGKPTPDSPDQIDARRRRRLSLTIDLSRPRHRRGLLIAMALFILTFGAVSVAGVKTSNRTADGRAATILSAASGSRGSTRVNSIAARFLPSQAATPSAKSEWCETMTMDGLTATLDPSKAPRHAPAHVAGESN